MMDQKIRDFALIENANFSREIKMVAQTTMAALHYIKELSVELGIPMEQITAEHIVARASESDAQIRKHQEWLASSGADTLQRRR